MFIDLTRYGGVRVLRVAVSAIAYIDAVDCGAAVHLIGAETLRVNEDPAEIEMRCTPDAAVTAIQGQPSRRVEYASAGIGRAKGKR